MMTSYTLYISMLLAIIFILCCENEVNAVDIPFIALAEAYTAAYNRLTSKATTQDCKSKIMNAFQENWESFFHEKAMPFEREPFYSQCPLPEQDYLPALKYEGEADTEHPTGVAVQRRDVERVDHETLGILYVMLVHQEPKFVMEIIEALNEPMHTFVIHVDTKSPDTYAFLSQYVSTSVHAHSSKQNVFVMHDNRVETNWGAFSIVKATLNTLKFGLLLNRSFDYVIDISGTTHPIKPNKFIRKFLSRNVNTIYNTHGSDSVVPLPELLHQYVECDGFVHRVARLTRPRGISVFVGSQWFAMPRHVAEWLLSDPLPIKYMQYAQHVVVADEQYFATMLMNSPYCRDMMNRDINYLIFTDFLAERGNIHKCLHPDPLRCGRSPTTLTIDMQPTIQMSHALFARKFNPSNADSMALLATIKETLRQDRIREHEHGKSAIEHHLDHVTHASESMDNDNTGGEFMIVMIEEDEQLKSKDEATADENDNHQEETNNESAFSSTALLWSSNCLTFPTTAGAPMEVVACDVQDQNQRFSRSKCISIDSNKFPEFSNTYSEVDGMQVHVQVDTSGAAGLASPLENYCSLQGVVNGYNIPGLMHEDEFFCVDISGSTPIPDSNLIAYPCLGSWNQYFRLSPEELTGTRSIASTIPRVVSAVTGMSDYPSTLCIEGKYVHHDRHHDGGRAGQNDNQEDVSNYGSEDEDDEDMFIEVKSNVCRSYEKKERNTNSSVHDSVDDEVGFPTSSGTQRFRFINLS